MSKLVSLLRVPKDNWYELKPAWDSLISNAFFELLKSEITTPPDWTHCLDLLDRWKDPPTEQVDRSFEIIEKALRCARVACRNIAELTSGTATTRSSDAELLDLSRDPWAWSLIQCLVESDPPVTSVPVALCDETGSAPDGYLGRFVLESYASDTMQLVRHPLDAFEPAPDDAFDRSLKAALEGAMALLGESASPCGLRWRVLRDDDGRCVCPTDRSISGAAARAFWFALQNRFSQKKVPNAGVILLAQISESDHRKLEGIGKYVREKVTAVMNKAQVAPIDEQIDTIVVASVADRDEADSMLRVLRAAKPIRVILPDA